MPQRLAIETLPSALKVLHEFERHSAPSSVETTVDTSADVPAKAAFQPTSSSLKQHEREYRNEYSAAGLQTVDSLNLTLNSIATSARALGSEAVDELIERALQNDMRLLLLARYFGSDAVRFDSINLSSQPYEAQ